VARVLFDSLLRKDANNKIIGGIASSYKTVSASEYQFKIRTDATCSDGTKITPTIVKNSLEHFASPEVHSQFKSLAFGPGTPTFTADDSTHTLDLKLSSPWSEVPAGLTLAQSGIICPAGLADLAGLAKGTVKGAFSGPLHADQRPAGREVRHDAAQRLQGVAEVLQGAAGRPGQDHQLDAVQGLLDHGEPAAER
jgi:peptide/nickel transport system substrate-binding protein